MCMYVSGGIGRLSCDSLRVVARPSGKEMNGSVTCGQ